MAPSEPASEARVPSRRQLTLLDCVGIGVNGIIGSGIFLLPQALYRHAGGRSPLAWLIVGGLCLLVGLCFAEAASYTDRSGGPYAYARLAFGREAGYAVGFIAVASTVLSYATVARGFTEHLAYVAPSVAGHEVLVGAAMIGALALTNLAGLKPAAWTSDALSAAKLLPLLALVVAGLWFLAAHGAGGRFAAAPVPAAGEHAGLFPAAMAGLFACTGFEFVSVPAGETRDPARAVPLALLGSLAGSVVLYALVQAIAVATSPDLANARPALAACARAIGGPAFGGALVVGALVSTFGFCAGSALVGPSYLAAFADDGMAPAALGRRRANGSPATAVVVYSAAAALLGNLGDYERLADVSSIAVVAQYLATCAAVPVLRRRLGVPSRGFRLPLGPLVPLLALGGCALFLSSVAWAEAKAAAAILAAGYVVRAAFVLASRRRSRRG